MKLVQRAAGLIAFAAFTPLVVFATLLGAASFSNARSSQDEASLARARAVTAQLDAELSADLAGVDILATSDIVLTNDWTELRARAERIASLRPAWRNVVVTDVASRTILFESASTARGGPAKASTLAFLEASPQRPIGGVEAGEGTCGCVALHRFIGPAPAGQVLTVERDLVVFQDVLVDAVEGRDEVAAVVDRDGLFIARSLDYFARLGTPGTRYVLDAVAAGGEGFYRGVTYEGLANRSAYATSDLSGWSTHIAVPAIGFTLLSAGSLGFTLIAAGIALAFSAVAVWVGVADLRTRRLAERAALQSQKLEAVGRLAGGVAHDFNNLLQVIVACLHQVRPLATDERAQKAVEHGLAAAQRGAALTQDLLSFSRDKPLEMVCVDLPATIEAVRPLLERSLGPGVALKVEVSPQARGARTNAAQLELALVNLAVNARDAMPEGGTFSIEARPARARGFVDLVVRDTGVGMTEEVAARALEPFFTTKPQGSGTGLGLAQVHALVVQSGGTLELETAPGKGAAFTLRLEACAP